MYLNMYRVQLWPNGRWDRQPWRMVAANSEDEAAYKATGERLEKAEAVAGPRAKLRARVMKTGPYGEATSFYVM
jgi:hypothetical protein